MRLKPQAKMALAIIMIAGTVVGLKAGIRHGLIPAPGTVKAVVPQERWTGNKWVPVVGVERDGDWNLAQSYSNGDDALVGKYRQPDDTTGYPALDNALRYVWNNAGLLMIVFGVLAGLSIFGSIFVSKLNGGETLNERMRREALEPRRDIHAPFDAPEGMQPASQYVSVRTRR